MNTALYFGSFNPLHIGHLSICRYVIQKTDVDTLRLVVSPRNPLKKATSLNDAMQRLEHVKSAIKKAKLGNKVSVSDIEYHMTPPLYTINTLRKIVLQEPQKQFVLIIGADNLAIIEKWYKWQELLREVPVWVYPRSGFNTEELCLKYGCQILNAPIIEISSTQIREAENRGLDMTDFKV